MDGIRAYLFSVIAASIISSIVLVLPGKSETSTAIRKLLTGIFTTLTVLAPLVSFRLPDLHHYLSTFQAEAAYAVQQGEMLTMNTTGDIIKTKLEAYILDKAREMGAELAVEISISTDAIPCGVTVTGDVSPFARQRLKELIAEDLGIPEEEQLWINEQSSLS